MSGIEIVGVVLGALPLIVSAYKHRKHIKCATTTLTHFEARYDEFVEDVEDVQLLLELSIRRLLAPLVTAGAILEVELERYMQDPDPSSEVHAFVAQALEDNRNKYNERCFQLMGEIHEAILTLMEEVEFYGEDMQAYLSREQNAKLISKASRTYLKSALEYRNAQLRFSLKSKTRETVLTSIRIKQQLINDLTQFSNTSIRMVAGPMRVGSKHAKQSLLTYAQHVARIYRLTQARWGCLCMETHFACIPLRHPAPRATSFDFFVIPNRDPKARRVWAPQGLDVGWSESRKRKAVEDTRVQPIKSKKKAADRHGKPALGAGEVSLPAFSARTSLPSRTSHTSAIAQTPSGSGAASWPAVTPIVSSTAHPDKEIDILCNVIATCGPTTLYLGTFTEPRESCQYSIHSLSNDVEPAMSVTLMDALQRDHPQKLWQDRTSRFRLALAIASAHLQILSAAWLSSHWTAKDILFPRNSTSCDRDADLGMPFVEGDFKSAPRTLQGRPDKAFTSLGIILMELLFGAVFEDHAMWQQEGWSMRISDPYSRLLVAKKWWKGVRKEGGPLYSSAVKWCLTESPSILKGAEWQEKLVSRVILPLEVSGEWATVDTV